MRFMKTVGLGVVVITVCGFGPNRIPNCNMSHVPSSAHAANSSHQAFSCCGPRRRSLSSAEYIMPVAPLGQMIRRFEGSYLGRNSSREHPMMPDSPVTMTSRTSAAVGPIKAIRLTPLFSTWSRTHSAPQRVFPNPRPA